MKKSIKIMGIAAMVLLLAVSCKKENKNGFNGETKFMTFSAGISQGDGKTYLDGLNLLWSEEDKININNAEFTLTNGAGSSKGEFEGEAEVAETYYAVYPYAESSSISGSTATVTLPAVQPYVAGSFDKNVAPMVAKTDDKKAFTFTNVCGLLRLNMTNIAQPFKKIVLQSAKADESLAGDGSVTISGDESDKFVITNGTGNKITVTSDENIASDAKIVFVLPAGTLTTGFNAYFYANADDATPFDNISGSGDWEIVAGQMNDVTVSHEVKEQDAIIQQDAVTTSSLKIPYVIQEECVKATIECATDDVFEHVVGTKVVVGGTKAGPYKTGDVTFTGLSAATPYYVRILVQSKPEEEEKPYCTIVAETLGDGPIVDEHQFVDLGLPSGRLWATCNVGAENDYDYGDYYAWGEILPYYADGHSSDSPCYDWREMTTCAGNTDISSGYAWHTYSKGGTNNELTEWSPKPYDDDYVLKPDYDVATQTWGEGWCMPTVADFKELKDNTDRTWYSSGNEEFNGVAGMKCVSKTDPTKFIFLPGANDRRDLGIYSIGVSGCYWANSCKVIDTKTKNADQLACSSTTFAVSSSGSPRFRGCTVRPVVKKVTE